MRHQRIDSLIRLWSWREYATSAFIAVVVIALLLTSESQPWEPYFGRALAVAVVMVWVASARVWHRRNNTTHA